jgi:hypothetical protein
MSETERSEGDPPPRSVTRVLNLPRDAGTFASRIGKPFGFEVDPVPVSTSAHNGVRGNKERRLPKRRGTGEGAWQAPFPNFDGDRF